ncbi:c-type cytochrome [Gemmatimonas sp.]|uniref:c-type cytochrome n=1 Tax=Gemmatimonas sp. TaxID=1962908 RepID=UPI0033416717
MPAWAFPTQPPPPKGTPPVVNDSVTLHTVPNSTRQFTMKQVNNPFDIPDWFPSQHPAMPSSVQYGVRPDGRACGYCHLPDGQGRPENGTLAGLPVEYTVRQVRAMRVGTRGIANPATPVTPMLAVAKGFTDDEVRTAAKYYARLKLTRRNIVREVTDVPTTRIAGLLYALDGTGTEPIAGRLIEAPESIERHELRDPWVRYTTYVPVGSLARGRRIAQRGPAGVATNCTTCHGPQLLGVGEVPPIAGRSPSNLLRQLINFRTRARADSTAAPMYPVVDALTLDDMVALAAYVGSLPPSSLKRK